MIQVYMYRTLLLPSKFSWERWFLGIPQLTLKSQKNFAIFLHWDNKFVAKSLGSKVTWTNVRIFIIVSHLEWVVIYMEKATAPYSSTLAWKIPWMEEPGRLQSMGSLRVRHDWATSLSLFTFLHWMRKWQPTPVFLPGESQGRRSLMGCRLWGCTESDTTEAT